MRLNIDRDLVKQLVSGQLPNKSRHLDELTHEPSIWQCDTGQWLSGLDSCQLTILWIANMKDVDLPRHAWDTPALLLIVSATLPVQSVDAYVRSVSHVTTKRKEVDHTLWVWCSVSYWALSVNWSPTKIAQILNPAKDRTFHRQEARSVQCWLNFLSRVRDLTLIEIVYYSFSNQRSFLHCFRIRILNNYLNTEVLSSYIDLNIRSPSEF